MDLKLEIQDSVKKKILLHACCAPCLTHPFRMLLERFDVTAFFYNPNIHPESEYRLRREEVERLSREWGFEVIIGPYDAEAWFDAVRRRGDDPEGGERCALCYRFRLEKTAEAARKNGADLFTTTLSISPLKKATVINRIGHEAAAGSGVAFYEADFKKKDGFKSSTRISREEKLYRQDYCGCVFSMREREKRRRPR